MRTHIKVTKEDIKLGRRWLSTSCPIALAIKRHLGSDSVVVGTKTVDINDGTTESFPLPYRVRKFVTSFDLDRNSVKPFSFYLKH